MCALLVMFSGCATTGNSKDPYESFNRDMHSFNLNVDEYVMKPVAKGYQWVTPNFVDRGVTNFFSNLQGIRLTFNDLLQAKFQDAGFDMLRFVVNSTVGLGGLFDVATELDVPRGNEDFAQTLGYWGVPSGPFLVLPFVGPSSPRAIGGSIGDAPLNPISYIGYAPVSVGLQAVNFTDTRADLLQLDDVIEEMKDYSLMRDAYLQRQAYLVSDGEITDDDFDDEEFYDESDEVYQPESQQ
ncbi:MAG TPA: VacJ family lipoprotein [Crenotrichaceae bacterium]|nr:VacJ family lipoprotein [Crenotrichaceae bacterium]